jgi:hypothetical protein
MKTIVLLASLLSVGTAAHAFDIVWVSFHSADDAPTANAQAAGFTTAAPDVGYTSLLSGNGYNVTRFVTKDEPTAADAAFLNGFDLIVIGRSVNSAHYQSTTERNFWNTTITAPLMNMSGYTLRESRLGYTTGGNMPDTTGTIGLTVSAPTHPIFAGITLDGANTMVDPYAGIVVYDSTTARGISVNANPNVAGGITLATVGTPGDGAFGGMVIGEWNAGTTMFNGQVLGGHRLVFLSGSREADTVSSETAGIYDLNPAGQQLFLNAVAYMVPEPSAIALFGIGASALLLRRRKS